MAIDNLNVIKAEKTKVMTIEQYFNEMPITDEQKKKRIDMADDLEMFFAYLLDLKDDFVSMPIEMLIGRVQLGMLEVAEKHIDITDNVIEKIDEDATYIVETTINYLDTPFYTSEDRALLLAENETQTLINMVEFEEAKEQGFQYKEWLAMLDERTRETHALADGQIVRLDSPFNVGGYLLMYPTDTSLGAPPEETVNCRCIIRYGRTL